MAAKPRRRSGQKEKSGTSWTTKCCSTSRLMRNCTKKYHRTNWSHQALCLNVWRSADRSPAVHLLNCATKVNIMRWFFHTRHHVIYAGIVWIALKVCADWHFHMHRTNCLLFRSFHRFDQASYPTFCPSYLHPHHQRWRSSRISRMPLYLFCKEFPCELLGRSQTSCECWAFQRNKNQIIKKPKCVWFTSRYLSAGRSSRQVALEGLRHEFSLIVLFSVHWDSICIKWGYEHINCENVCYTSNTYGYLTHTRELFSRPAQNVSQFQWQSDSIKSCFVFVTGALPLRVNRSFFFKFPHSDDLD